jgi:hypothetical protein
LAVIAFLACNKFYKSNEIETHVESDIENNGKSNQKSDGATCGNNLKIRNDDKPDD